MESKMDEDFFGPFHLLCDLLVAFVAGAAGADGGANVGLGANVAKFWYQQDLSDAKAYL